MGQRSSNNGGQHQGAYNVIYGERFVRSDPAQASRVLAVGPLSRSISAQRHDSVLVLACRLCQLERLACVEHLPHFCISAAQHGFPRIGRSSTCRLQCYLGWSVHLDVTNYQGHLKRVWPHDVSCCTWPPKYLLSAAL